MSKLGIIMIEHQTAAVLWAIQNRPTAFEYMMTKPLDTRPMEEIQPGKPKVSQVDLLKMLAEASPKTLLVIRAYPDDLDHPDFQDRMLKWSEPFRAVSDRVVAHSINEYVPWTADDAKRLSDYEAAFAERMNGEGLLPMCFCFPESHLGGPELDQGGNFLSWGALRLWQHMIPGVKRLFEMQGFLGLNEYDWPAWNSSRDKGYKWRLGHWELNVQLIGNWLSAQQIPRVGIGEGILDGKIYTSRLPRDHRLWNAPWGYRRVPKPGDDLPAPFDQILVGKTAQAYLGDLVGIENDSYHDPRVAFFLVFAWAPRHHHWDPYDVSVMADLLSQRLKDSPPEYWEPGGTMEEKLRVLMPDGKTRLMDMETEYLPAVVGAEIPEVFDPPLEALKAQAVAARSFARAARVHGYFRKQGGGYHPTTDVCTTTHCQAWIPEKIYPLAVQAVEETNGIIARHEGQVALTYYSARCGGQTVNNEVVFPHQSPKPYLRAVECPDKGQKQGHGVGLCQHGAMKLARQGKSYIDILKHFYRGIELPTDTSSEEEVERLRQLLEESEADRRKKVNALTTIRNIADGELKQA